MLTYENYKRLDFERIEEMKNFGNVGSFYIESITTYEKGIAITIEIKWLNIREGWGYKTLKPFKVKFRVSCKKNLKRLLNDFANSIFLKKCKVADLIGKKGFCYTMSQHDYQKFDMNEAIRNQGNNPNWPISKEIYRNFTLCPFLLQKSVEIKDKVSAE